MASQTQGIQQLLHAEKKAAEKINEARKRKTKRLKQAKEEAQAEVDKYRQEQEHKFGQYEARHLGSKEDVQAAIERDTLAQLGLMQDNVSINKKEIIDEILALCCHIQPTVHRNLTKKTKQIG